MAKKKILFINQEITPYVPDNTLSLMGKDLPKVMQERSHEIRTFMPKWGNINERRGQLHEVIRLSGMNLIINDTDHPLIIKVASIQSARVQVYFIDNDDYFGKRLIERDEAGVEYDDNGERDRSRLRRQWRACHFLCPWRAGDGEETALGARHHSLSGMDEWCCAFLRKDCLS